MKWLVCPAGTRSKGPEQSGTNSRAACGRKLQKLTRQKQLEWWSLTRSMIITDDTKPSSAQDTMAAQDTKVALITGGGAYHT